MLEKCCPVFDSKPWHDVLFKWEDKRFIKGEVKTFFYIPFGFGKTMTKLVAEAEKFDAKTEAMISLSNHLSKWKMELLLEVSKEIPTMENVILRGNFYSRVYEGDFKEMGRWMKDFGEVIEQKGYQMKRMFTWYTTCPKCAKEYGKNYTVMIAEI